MTLALLSVFIPAGERTGRRTLACLSAVAMIGLAGCGGGDSFDTQDAERALTVLMQQRADEQFDIKVFVGDARCVDDGDRRWSCIVQVDPQGQDPFEVTGSLTCDGENCLFRAD